jgi:hypothetical protein
MGFADHFLSLLLVEFSYFLVFVGNAPLPIQVDKGIGKAFQYIDNLIVFLNL